jgi:hypothetical protein
MEAAILALTTLIIVKQIFLRDVEERRCLISLCPHFSAQHEYFCVVKNNAVLCNCDHRDKAKFSIATLLIINDDQKSLVSFLPTKNYRYI